MTAPIEFSVTAPNPDDHCFDVRMEVPDLGNDKFVDLQLPVWTPGSYLVREYARHVQTLEALDVDGEPLGTEKVDKTTWRVDAGGRDRIVARYTVYAHTLNVREKHLDGSHGFFQPTALLMHPKDRLDRPALLEIEAPREDWEIFCPLEKVEGARGDETGWRAPNFEVLYDAPVEMGPHDVLEFEAAGADHRMVFWGEGDYDADRLAADLPKIVEANTALFEDCPYDEYLFINLLSDGAYGGLEHRNSTSLIYPQNQFGQPDADAEPPFEDDDYLNFLSLVAHEHFHTWNVKRIRPETLADIDYERENYLRELWTVEGITSYYDTRALLRAGLMSGETYLGKIADGIERLERTPGRHVQSLEEASFDAWIKFYRRDEQTPNATVSYYLKGSLVALLLDLRIRRETDGQRALDDLMERLWADWEADPDAGYAPGTHEALACEVADADLTDFFDAYIRGTQEIDWERELATVGLELHRDVDEDSPATWIGASTRSGDDGLTIASVLDDSPAAEAGLYPGDTWVAFDGWQIEEESQLDDRLKATRAGESVDVHVFRRGQLVERQLDVRERPADDYTIALRDDADAHQRDLLAGWLGTTDIQTSEDV